MKKLIFFLLIASSVLIYSQDIEPNQVPIISQIDSSYYYFSADSIDFQQDEFILGWAWSCGKKMSEALSCSQAHVGHSYPANIIKDNVKLIINANDVYQKTNRAPSVRPLSFSSVFFHAPHINHTNHSSDK